MVKKNKFYHGKFPLVCIEWEDAQDHETGWSSLKKAQKHETAPVVSVGWILEETDKKYVLAGDFILEDLETSRITSIPKDWCQKVTKLVFENDS
ncbi:MAG: hypothetical protein ACR2ON_06120 [Paracoccaceae bacterium]|jgi:hypothetical protein|tara:strand:+ start:982 stop:1263 length:282 start_codon:yes stop_codon:yes gene_type:complete